MVSISTLVDRVKIRSLSSGTGPFQLGPAVPAYRGTEVLIDGATYSYAVEDGANYEFGTGVYLASTDQLVRTPLGSSRGGAAVPFGVNVEINFTALAQDLEAVGGVIPIIDSEGDSPTSGISQRAATVALASKLDTADAPQFFKTTILWPLTVNTDGQTSFSGPPELTMLVAPLVVWNGSILSSTDYSWSGTGITLTEPASLGDVGLLIIGIGVDQSGVDADNVVGLTAYVQGVLGSRQADVRDIAGYDPTGTNDMAGGLTALLAQAAIAKVPTVAPGCAMLLGSPVDLPRGTDFRGTGAPSFDTITNAGTVFKVAHGGKGFVDVGGTGGCLLSDIVFYRNQPAVVSGSPWTPNDDDFDIYSADMSDFHGTRVYHMNSTRGIYMNGNRNRFTDCCGQFFKRGLQVDWSYDSLRVVGTHNWPFFSQATEVRDYMQNNLELYRLGRVDNPMFIAPFSIWAKYCFYIGYFPGDGPSKPAGTVSKLKLVSADLDIGQFAYFVAPEASGHTAKFSAVTSQGMAEIVNAVPLQIEGPNTKITGDFSGSDVGANLVRLEASAAGSELSLQVTGNNWNRSGGGFAAVEVVTGGGHVSLLPGSVPLLTNGNGGPISTGDVKVWDNLV